MLDPYTVLEVTRDASPEEIKHAYRRLAKALHPDLNPNNPASARRFRDVTAAYDILSDDSKRRQYDQEVAAAEDAARRGSSGDDSFDGFFRRAWKTSAGTRRPENAGFSDGGFRSARSGMGFDPSERLQHRGADIYQSLRVSFAEATLGTKKRVIVNDDRAIDLVIPPLTEDGQTMRVKGQGGRGNRGGAPGDLFVEISVDSHTLFTRKGYDIKMILPVTVPEAMLGATVAVPTLHGMVQLKIPSGSNTDTVLRLRGKGIPAPHDGPPGDQFVTLKVILPDAKDPSFTQMVTEWHRNHTYSVRPKYTE